MSSKFFRYYAPLGISLLSFAIVSVGIIFSRDWLPPTAGAKPSVLSSVLGKTTTTSTTPVPTQDADFDTVISPLNALSNIEVRSAVSTKVSPLLPLQLEHYDIVLVSGPGELVDGNQASFTWYVSGSPATIHTTTIYFGTTSTPGSLSTALSPGQTRYTDDVKDFLHGDYVIPIRFVGNSGSLKQGTYYYRAYASIQDKHYWTDERMFTVGPQPLNKMTLVSYPKSVAKGGNAAFTWDIFGPPNVTNFTAIVGGQESKPGSLDTTVDLPKTPYSVLVKDFISGTYNIPIRLVGNAIMSESGPYYFRALSFINGKNIWSDEFSFTVQ